MTVTESLKKKYETEVKKAMKEKSRNQWSFQRASGRCEDVGHGCEYIPELLPKSRYL